MNNIARITLFMVVVVVVGTTTSAANVIRIESGSSFLLRSEEPAVVVVRNEKFIPITSLNNEIRGSLLNKHQYSTGHGITVIDNTEAIPGRGVLYQAEAGRMVQSDVGLVKSGSYSYTTLDGQPITVTYVADENGFRAEGAHLPRSVELPAEHAEAHREALARVNKIFV